MNPAHDRINLTRIVARIQHDVDGVEQWQGGADTLKQTSLHATAATRKIAFARQLLASIDADEHEPQSSSQQRNNAATADTLDRLQDAVQHVQRRLAALRAHTKPTPSVLASLPMPTEPAAASTPSADMTLLPSYSSLEPELPTPTPHDELIALIPSTPKPSAQNPRANLLPGEPPAFLATSLQTQDALSSQLADMAVQLRRNAEHFGTALEKDAGVVEIMNTKLESNLGNMSTQRVALKIASGKSRGTTWLVFISVVVVAVAWVFMLFLIRFTRW